MTALPASSEYSFTVRKHVLSTTAIDMDMSWCWRRTEMGCLCCLRVTAVDSFRGNSPHQEPLPSNMP